MSEPTVTPTQSSRTLRRATEETGGGVHEKSGAILALIFEVGLVAGYLLGLKSESLTA
jgi:hypothetical protein